ncbi:MAG: DNA cytosine methyltransferase [Fulvivirga sp.]|uniref:DNA cytosine methyltransferase n=1 Tax=Fulvivirga sp. TaxID=1931237 RepID=UPI0032EAAEAE
MSIPVIDLFSGAGGLGLGATKAGGDLRLSVEIDRLACDTMEANPTFHKGKVLCEDVCNLSGDDLRNEAGLSKDEPLILVGGPPCQPFSKASYWTDPGHDSKYRQARSKGISLEKPSVITEAKPDQRRDLLQEYFRLIGESNANGFLFENVPSIMHPRNKRTFEEFKIAVESIGFKTLLVKVNGLDFGIAQKRQRIILLGLRGQIPREPIKSHSEQLDDLASGLKRYVTVGDALKPFQGDEYAEPEEVISGRWAKQLKEIPPGMNYKALTEWAGHPNPTFVAETRFWNFLLKLHPDQVSWTIAANPGPWTGPFHWNSRRLRIVELSVLQGFPADYKFIGKRRDKVKQIGNALPSNIAHGCLKPLIEDVIGITKSRIAI